MQVLLPAPSLPTISRGAPPEALTGVAAEVDDRLSRLLAREAQRWIAFDESLAEPLEALSDLVRRGGKRLRPAFCHLGWVAAGGRPLDGPALDAGVAIELLHAFALLHDDVMDGSPTRRGAPTAHASFTARHRSRGWRGEDRRFGEGVAILIGDLAHVLADRSLNAIPDAALDVWHELRVELTYGQYLDIVSTASATISQARARRIARYKSGRYTVLRPLQLGAALAGVGPGQEIDVVLGRYGDPLGEAFQLRDDVLGAFGDPAVTGKPAGDDLRDGKPTLLVAIARDRATAVQLRLLDVIGAPELGPDEIEALQEVLVDTGAVVEVERRIDDLTAMAAEAVTAGPAARSLEAAVVSDLLEMAAYVTGRSA